MMKRIMVLAGLLLFVLGAPVAHAMPMQYDFSGLLTSALGVPGVSAGQAYSGTIVYDPSSSVGANGQKSFYATPLQMTLAVNGVTYDVPSLLRHASFPDNGNFYTESSAPGALNVISSKAMSAADALASNLATRDYGIALFMPLQGSHMFATLVMTTTDNITGNEISKRRTLTGSITDYSVRPVPIPPAVWLMGSALVGLFGIRRRLAA